ncbi:hypothetical protein TGAM01_v203728 [Trichoderma gamsii]|uniref:Uncharacterized protein n=1 Tax=Trichoderma gamsii TaxID=398673 RepID=A0A2P4ZSU7_9HYPO|nr:hypothetical protein TGAM01_v203728 [Trichoderma gamsii]PON27347.1 hypothetical protein TGAM01_v203728 [Trichoderma gamsii]
MSTTYHQGQSCIPAVPAPVGSDECLSSRADFIPSWLNHMQNNPPRDILQPKSPLDSSNLSWHPNGLTTVRIQPNSDTRLYESSDLFIQNSPEQLPLSDPTYYHQDRQPAPDSDHGQNLHDGERHSHTLQPASTTSENLLTKKHVFEKQPRRKTRRDRYDTMKSKEERVRKKNREKSSTRVSKKGRVRSSREVMANFSSSAIANPGEKITLEQKFTPGLFVNGRSSASLGDLAFNDIPLNHEYVEKREKEHPPTLESKQRKKRDPRPDETKSFTDALKRLIADYPPPESASRPTSTVVSSVTCMRRSDRDNNERPLQRDSHTPRSHTPRSLSIRSHPTAVNSSRSLIQKTQGRRTIEQDFTAVRSREDHTPNGRDTTGFPKYQDKGVMVSPWMHQRARENVSLDMTSGDQPLRRRRAESFNSRADIHMPNTIFEIPNPEVREGVAEEVGVNAKGIEDLTYPHDRMPPTSCFYSTSGPHPPNAMFPPFVNDLSPFDRLDASKVIGMQHRDAYSIDWPANSTTLQPQQEAFLAANTVSQRISQIVDNIPGETLKEYIARMEREILGADEPSAGHNDKVLLPAEADIFDTRIRPSKPLREIGHHNRSPQQDGPHDSVDPFPRHYSRRPYPEENPNESEPAFVWQPNHMMWR